MRLTCPHCLTEYDVPDDAVAGRKRTLRCYSCGHQWRHDAGGNLPESGEEPVRDADPVAPAPPRETPTPTPPAPVTAADQRLIDVPPLLAPGVRKLVPREHAAARPRGRSPLIVLGILVLAVVAVLAAHRPIGHAWPASVPAFEALGLK